jgi:PKHD-type hydroxylase
MQLRNYYYYFKNAISPEDCDKIIELGLDKMRKTISEGHSIFGKTGGRNEKQSLPNASPQNERTLEQVKIDGDSQVYIRDSKISWLNDQWIYDLVWPYIHKANKYAGWNWNIDYAESLQFSEYDNDQFYGWHCDGDSDHFGKYRRYLYGITGDAKNAEELPRGYVTDPKFVGKVRKISMTINLNTEQSYEGGNLKFDFGPHAERTRFHECEEIRGQGSIIIFPSFTPHCVTPVTSGKRYSLVMWCLGEPFK